MNTKVNIAGITFKNPILTASGTFGSGEEYAQFIDLNCLGGKSHLKEVLWLHPVWIAYWIARVKSTTPLTSQPITPTENAGCSSRPAS